MECQVDDDELDFLCALRDISLSKTKLKKAESELVQYWLDRLNTETTTLQKKRRNEYAKFLQYMLKRGSLHYPFILKPSQGQLVPLEEIFSDKQSYTYAHSSRNSELDIDRKPSFSDNLLFGAHPLQESSKLLKPCASSDIESGFKESILQSVPNKSLEDIHLIIAEDKMDTTLEEFLAYIAPMTKDKGATMLKVTSLEISSFRDSTKCNYVQWVHRIGKILLEEQRTLKMKYQEQSKKIANKSNAEVNNLKCILPHFNYDDYLKEVDHIDKLILSQIKRMPEGKPPDKLKHELIQRKSWLIEDTKRVQCFNDNLLKKLKELQTQFKQLSKYSCHYVNNCGKS